MFLLRLGVDLIVQEICERTKKVNLWIHLLHMPPAGMASERASETYRELNVTQIFFIAIKWMDQL